MGANAVGVLLSVAKKGPMEGVADKKMKFCLWLISE